MLLVGVLVDVVVALVVDVAADVVVVPLVAAETTDVLVDASVPTVLLSTLARLAARLLSARARRRLTLVCTLRDHARARHTHNELTFLGTNAEYSLARRVVCNHTREHDHHRHTQTPRLCVRARRRRWRRDPKRRHEMPAADARTSASHDRRSPAHKITHIHTTDASHDTLQNQRATTATPAFRETHSVVSAARARQHAYTRSRAHTTYAQCSVADVHLARQIGHVGLQTMHVRRDIQRHARDAGRTTTCMHTHASPHVTR
jgi:hypothetical protein